MVALYHHDTSRELDPQLHAHAVAAKLTYDDVGGRVEGASGRGIYERRAYLSEVYRNALAREILQLGYEIEDRRDSKGNDAGFEIRGVSKELIEKYSQRSQQRDARHRGVRRDEGSAANRQRDRGPGPRNPGREANGDFDARGQSASNATGSLRKRRGR